MNKDIHPVSRADLAQVIASALLEPNACNLVSFFDFVCLSCTLCSNSSRTIETMQVLYMTKAQQRGIKDGDTFQKFARLRQEKENAPFQ